MANFNPAEGSSTAKKSFKSFRIGGTKGGQNQQTFEEKTEDGFVMRGMKPAQNSNPYSQLKAMGLNQESQAERDDLLYNSIDRSSEGNRLGSNSKRHL